MYKVCNLGDSLSSSASLIDACRLEYSTPGLSDVIKSKGSPACSVKYMKLMGDGNVLVFLSDGYGVYEYE